MIPEILPNLTVTHGFNMDISAVVT